MCINDRLNFHILGYGETILGLCIIWPILYDLSDMHCTYAITKKELMYIRLLNCSTKDRDEAFTYDADVST